jgi:3-hydroxyacyl-[acyl-carrier-protein] dehydratase
MNTSISIDVAADHAAFAGHFPNFPVLPGAILLDEALRIIAGEVGIDPRGWQIASAKFLGAVRPGDALRLEWSTGTPEVIRFNIWAAERKVVSGMLASASPPAV